MASGLQWDIFCHVIDNHGDLGVCWRLAADLAGRGERVRLWVDDPSALAWMAPEGKQGVDIRSWQEAESPAHAPEPFTDVLVEAFGCDIPNAFLDVTVKARAGRTHGKQPVWINLEYLSAEAYVARSHGLPSPVMSGPAKGWTKRFFYPGFTSATGGLLREPDLPARQRRFDATTWRSAQGLAHDAPAFHASLFCYEPQALAELLQTWAARGHHGQPVKLLVTPGRAAAAVRQCMTSDQGLLEFHFLPYLTQTDFDHLLWSCDLNLVRGEDSLVRAIWAGKPMVWQLYPQDDDAHGPKLEAFLDACGATPASRAWHGCWNAWPAAVATGPLRYPSANEWADWQAQALEFRDKLQAQADLSRQLLGFVDKSG